MSQQQLQHRAVLANSVIIGLLSVVIIILMSIFIVYEGSEALVSRFGRLRTDANGQVQVYKPGFHFHIPGIESIKHIDMRLQGFLVPSERIYTQEQKNVRVDYYVRYVVNDVQRFYLSTGGNFEKAARILRGKINDTLREEIGKRQLNDVITGQRGDIMNTLKLKSDESAQNIGIKVIDVRIVKLDYPEEVSQSVYTRMREARERMATMYRAEGDSESEMIRAKGDADVVRILAKAKQQGADIRARGDAQAAAIYNDAYSQNRKFFEFLRTMDLYGQSIGEGETMLLDVKTMKLFNRFVTGSDIEKTS